MCQPLEPQKAKLAQAGFANFVGLRDFYAFIKLLDRVCCRAEQNQRQRKFAASG